MEKLGVRIDLDGAAEYTKALKDINSGTRLLKSEMELAVSGFDKTDKSVEALTARNKALGIGIDSQKEKIAFYEKALASSTEETNKTGKSTQEWQILLNKAQSQLNGMEREVGNNEKAIEEMGDEMSVAAKETDKLGGEFEESGKQSSVFADVLKANLLSDAIISGFNKIVDVVASVGRELVNISTEAIRVGMDFEQQMSAVQAISGATGEELIILGEKAKEMGASTEFSAKEAGEAFEYMAMAGWDVEEMMSGLSGIMNLASASGEDLATVSDIVTDAMTAFGLSADQSAHFADVLAATATGANTTVGIMGETFKHVAPLAGAMGYSIEDMSVAIGLMANAGVKGQKTGTSLKNIITNLASPTDSVTAAMNELGVSLVDNEGRTKSFEEVVNSLRQGFSSLTETEKASYAATIAGTQGMSGLLALVNSADEDYDKLAQSINNCNGAAEEMANIRLDNLAGDITVLKSAAQGLAIEAYEGVAPAFREVVQEGTSMVNGLIDAVKSGGLEGLVGQLGDTFSQIVTFISQNASSVVDAATSIIDSFIDGITENLDTIIDGGTKIIDSLIDGIGKVLPKLSTVATKIITPLAKGLLNKLPDILKIGVDVILELVNGISAALPDLVPAIVECVTKIAQVLVDNLHLLLDAALQLITALADGLIDALPVLIEALPDIITGIVDFLKSSIPKIVDTGIKLLTAITENLPEIINQIVAVLPQLIIDIAIAIVELNFLLAKAGFDLFVSLTKNLPEIKNEIKKAVPKLIKGIIEAFTENFGKIKDVGKNLVEGLWNGISDAKDWILEKIEGFGGAILDGIKGFFGIESPSKLLRDMVGKNMALGIGVGFVDEMEQISKNMQNAIPTDFDVNPQLHGNVDFSSVTATKANMANFSTPVHKYIGETSGGFGNDTTLIVSSIENLAGIVNKMANKMGYSIYLDTGTLVGELAPGMDNELGNLKLMRTR